MAYKIDDRLPHVVYAHASPPSRGGVSLFDGRDITSDTARDFVSEDSATRRAAEELEGAGFRVLARAPATISIAGPPALYEEQFGTSLVTVEREVIQRGAPQLRTTRTFLDSAGADLPGLIAPGGRWARFLEGVALDAPASRVAGAVAPPRPDYWHLTLDDVAEHLGARTVHEQGIKGAGVRLTMVDTGWEPVPYFAERGSKGTVVLGPEAADPGVDEDGHGTCESANAFAVAPEVDFTMVKFRDPLLVDAFDTAASQHPRPHIISMSVVAEEKYPPLSADSLILAVSVSLAIADGIVVVCAAGNGHHGYPAQHPEVIAVGGVHRDQHGGLEASDYASGFTSALYTDRLVPDVSGLVGMLPGATYILLPAPPGSDIDQSHAKEPYPFGDGTTAGDGWVVLSGTSAAAPQVAGVCALLLQTDPALEPREVRRLLEASAVDVTRGASNKDTGGIARPNRDNATGYGLVDADAAVRLARQRRQGQGVAPQSGQGGTPR
ncbi:peptidase S8 [Streptomyces tauricus]|nr:peptidase S8 [Streptomyces tauricus]